MRLLFALASFALLPACTAHVVDVGAQTDSGPIPDAGSPEVLPEAGPTPASFSPAQVQAAQSACSAPHGNIDVYASPTEMLARMEGAWLLCGANTLAGSLGVSVAGSGIWGSDGTFHALVADSTGGLVEGHGLMEQATYSVVQPDDASAGCSTGDAGLPNCIVNYVTGTGGLVQLGADFEKGPRRMLLGGTDWYVPLTP